MSQPNTDIKIIPHEKNGTIAILTQKHICGEKIPLKIPIIIGVKIRRSVKYIIVLKLTCIDDISVG